MPADSGNHRRRWFARLVAIVLVLGFFGTCLLLVGARAAWWHTRDLHPEQPIDFPHTIHAGRLGLACTFCHTTVAISPAAGVPSLEKCLNCHRSVATDKPGIRVLQGHFERQEPIRWARVHALPHFIHFTHKRHVKAGVDCFACHGNVAKMTTARQVRPLKMGWCVTCHRQQGASTDCATCHQ